MTEQYRIGQRWISDTEAALGLGMITDTDGRFVEVSFDAAETTRRYAANNAPLTRVIFKEGEQIKNLMGESFEVAEVMEDNGLIGYIATDANAKAQLISEPELDFALMFSKPQDRLLACQVDSNYAYRLRINSLQNISQHQRSTVHGLLGARIGMLPHQIYISSEVAKRHAPRVLLADEVGLGKTIEAGLIIHQQLISGDAERVLIVVPDSLVFQWLVEMLRRFNLRFSVYDQNRIEQYEEDQNAFEQEQLVITNIGAVMDNDNFKQDLLGAQWDLTVIDEAHHYHWAPEQASPEYQVIEHLAANSQGLLLLTATPEQLGLESHFARLKLLDPARFHDLNAFINEEQDFSAINSAANDLINASENSASLSPALIDTLGDKLNADSLALLKQAQNDDSLIEEACDNAVADLLERHGTGRVLFRNTRQAVAGFPERILHQYPLELPESYSANSLQPEDDASARWFYSDPRVSWLSDFLREDRSTKVLVICALDKTAQELEEYLRLRAGVKSAVFCRGLSLVNRDRAAAYFADDEDGAQTLICSEIGSEGRNFQFAQHLVLFDLPAQADLLEQRIGRLDRIGQQGKIHIHVPFFENSLSQVYLDWYHQGLNAFNQTCAIGSTVANSQAELLAQLQLDASNQGLKQQLINDSQAQAQSLRLAMEQGRDKLLERNSLDPAAAQTAIDAISATEQPEQLAAFMQQIFDYFGVDSESGGDGLYVVRPSEQMLCEYFPGLSEDGATITFDRQIALQREDVQFLSWEHPMVSGALELMTGNEYGNTAICTLKHPKLKAGTWMIETIFSSQISAPKYLKTYRYMPQQIVRLLTDNQGKNLGSQLKHGQLNELSKSVSKKLAPKLIKQLAPALPEIIDLAQQTASQHLPVFIDKAITALDQQLGGEIKRLQSLQQLNPNIRDSEINYLIQSQRASRAAIEQTQLKFEAIRIIICA